MNSLKIIQPQQLTEYNVPSSVVAKLREISESIVDDEDILLEGTINTAVGIYLDDSDYLTQRFNYLHIIAPRYYIRFADPEVLRVLMANGIGDGVGITLNNMLEATSLPSFNGNQTIRTFNELQYFTKITKILYNCFTGCTNLTSIILPNSVDTIYNNAFLGSGLISITFSRKMSLMLHAFRNCYNLKSVYISDIADWCHTYFNYYTSNPLTYAKHLFLGELEITDLIIPNTVTHITDYAFYDYSGLTSIVIPSSTTEIGYLTFFHCTNLASVTMNGSIFFKASAFQNDTNLNAVYISLMSDWLNSSFASEPSSPFYYSHHLYIGNEEVTSVTIPDGTISIKKYLFAGGSYITSVIIPNSVISIELSAFAHCSSLTSFIIPDNVTNIEDNVFYNCSSLTSITIGNSVINIGKQAFYGCNSLTSVTIPDSVVNIGNNIFLNCSNLTSITIGNSVTSIGEYSFLNCSSLTSIIIPNSVTEIGNRAFQSCSNMTSITIGNNVITIKDQAFRDCSSLTSIIIPDSVTSMGTDTFYNCRNLTSVTIGNNVTSIGKEAFISCVNLTSVIIGTSVTSIGSGAFFYCSSLAYITIPGNVTSIGGDAFRSCTGLSSLTVETTIPPTLGSNAFFLTNKNLIIYGPTESVEAYKAASGWSTYASRILAIPST